MKIDIFGKTIELAGSTGVADYLQSELSSMPTSPGSSDIHINIVSGFKEELSRGLTGGTKVTEDAIIIDRRKPVPVRGVKNLVHNYVGTLGRQLRISREPSRIKVEIRYDNRVTDHNPVVREAFRSINRSYINRSQNLAKVILYNDIEPIIHQILLEDGAGFIHASCVSRDGQGIVLSGWGGAGKTSAATNLIKNGNWNFVSDDLCLVNSDGLSQPYLKRIQLYPYNIGPQDKGRFLEGDSVRNRLNWYLRATLLGEKSVRRRIKPSNRYPVSDHDVDISTLIYLIREDRRDLTHDTEELSVIAQRAAATIAHEYETHIQDLRPLAATHPGVWPSGETFVEETAEVYERTFESAVCRLVRVPQNTTPAKLAKYLQQSVLSKTTL